MTQPLIIWEKWVDPFGENMEDAKWTDYNNDIDDSTEMFNEEYKKHIGKPIRVIASPLGLIPYNEYTASSKIFNFWLGHTNFNISENIKNIIENVSGVEILDIFTRYRFRIAIGKCFNDSETMATISTSIIELFNHGQSK
jgi:hypothetical protein